VAGAEYFLTICTAHRAAGLGRPDIGSAILDELRAMERDATWAVRCATIMPDHLHLLVALGERLPLARAVQRLKAKTSHELAGGGLQWERGFFDHRMRPNDDALLVFLYIYLNPYRASLLDKSEAWPWYYCAGKDWGWFRSYLKEERPVPEWLV
jgi:putative transposase